MKLEGDCSGSEVKLSWDAPSKYIGPVDHYIVEYSHVDAPKKWHPYTIGGGKTASKITETFVMIKTADLPDSATLVFRVRAISLDGKQGKACEGTKVGSCATAAGSMFCSL